ncbi:hypothetical protein L208DRAFT_1201950, partial [Tricholoma matsutake]
WSSPFASWHARALSTPHPSPHTFTPTRQSLLLVVLLNSPVEHEGISLTLYSDNADKGATVAIDAYGRVLLVSEKDAAGILALTRKTLELPKSELWRNTWVVQQQTTSQAIHRLFIQSPDPDKHLEEVGVQGFSKETRQLKTPVEGFQILPDSLWGVTGLVLEAREGGDEARDDVVLRKVREIVNDLF